MAGHSKWANIQHRKGRVDAARGKMWSKLSKAIIMAAKSGGGDPMANFRLRKAIDDAKAVSMPKDNIERAIKRGTGELDGGDMEEILYEGYGPGGVAVMCEAMTDNRNRTAPEMKQLFSKFGGNLGNSGCVSYLFDRKGVVVFEDGVDEEQVTMIAMEHGGEDIDHNDDGKLQVTSPPDAFDGLVEAFTDAELAIDYSEVSQVPQTTVDLESDMARKVLSLLQALDDHDDVQNVSTNLNITDEALQEEDA
ncbi:YebC/PmpR family DNA-binding transcriptional regulator [Crateriforma conspicua]|uniref:Probable transcriptional regulatory protein Pan14r_06980 n=1 Tax=Crateriforma conspicua TaxID=2527996 RepID=A0A5C5Y1C8_9PLAN|nr:YebC/PmpR family DNA-binding transcriptional regulator [Crateriforma conspicua]QDV62783.1 Transcriptional regulatory protein PmpR [Crateriforma conspicua]TWT68453.1 Transcriptional regulatory protein PmpR [Crateriforma conspicua]